MNIDDMKGEHLSSRNIICDLNECLFLLIKGLDVCNDIYEPRTQEWFKS